ncbi:hypothetical protein SBF1_8060002 [Candidatus Desulfosporosinus infrequens]|uniref:Uncharacterized protein n=1 Tax=Candidatus Desulfosporosinus infrequens TaxID=2043169 RepID=A0A2U3LTH2_9FIRM|nr:hypothetical protein SBF1_8060002 [Candidatus Desulfosporosinus infrequens]
MLNISFHDWVLIFSDIFWEYESIVTNIPGLVWLSIVLTVGVTLLDRIYLPKSIKPSDESSIPNGSIIPNAPNVPNEKIDENEVINAEMATSLK